LNPSAISAKYRLVRALEIKRLPQAFRFRWSDGKETEIPLSWLRTNCTCAVCLERGPQDAPLFSSPQALEKAYQPQAVSAVGNYGFEVVWLDSHRSIFAFERVRNSFENMTLPPHLQALSVSKETRT